MAKIKKIKLGSTTYDLCDAAATHKVDGVTGSTVNHFGTCSIAAGTAAKTVSITAGTFSLETGAKVTVKFTNKNTASTPTLNVNSTGAKNIFHNGAQITTGGNKSLLYGTVDFVYDGTQWQLIGNYVDTNTHNSHTLSSGTKANGTTEIVGASSSGKLTLGASGVTQGAYGPGASENPASAGTVTVPEITVNDKGIVVDAVDRSLALPSISIPNKSSSDTTDLVYAVSNLVESGVNGHTITPTYSGLPTKAYVDKVATGHVKYLGTATALTSLSTTAGQGDFYRVSTAFTFGSETAHVGDIILATKDNPAQNTTDWDLIHTEINTNTWTANTVSNSGYVASGSGQAYKVWHTDAAGNPAWRSLGEANLAWGGRSIAGGISPVGASLSSEHSANRLAYLNPAALLFEYSDNAGSSWTDLQWANDRKVRHVTTSEPLYIGASPTVTTSHSSRMTLTAQNGTSGYIYTRPKKLLINMCNNGHGVKATIEYKTGVSGAAWNTLGTYDITGWSGWNEIDVSSLSTLGGGSTQTSNNWYWRFTYKVTSINSSYKTSRPYIIGLRLFGDTCWTRTSNLGEYGHLYSYDWEQNATFPAAVTATTNFYEAGTALSAKYQGLGTVHSTNTSEKIFLVGTTTQGSSKQAYSHDTAYVGTDGCLYSGGSKVLTSYTNTKNTAGSTNTSSKIYLIGATTQAANPQTYSHDTAYVGTDGCLYSGGTKVLTAHPTITTNTDTTSTGTLSHSGTFTAIDSVTRDSNGHVTKVNTKTYTLPSSGNTDTKVNTTLATTTKAYLLGTSTTPTSTAQAVTAVADTGVYLDTTAGKLTATTFKGTLEGTATTATKLSNTTAIGSATNPVYFTASGVPTACTYSLNKTVPSNAVFTDTNTKVSQYLDETSSSSHDLLFSYDSSNSDAVDTNYAGHSNKLIYTPDTGMLSIGTYFSLDEWADDSGDSDYAGDGNLYVSGDIIVGGGNDDYGIVPARNNWSSVGREDLPFYRIYGSNIYEGGTSLSSKYASKTYEGKARIGTTAYSFATATSGTGTANTITFII